MKRIFKVTIEEKKIDTTIEVIETNKELDKSLQNKNNINEISEFYNKEGNNDIEENENFIKATKEKLIKKIFNKFAENLVINIFSFLILIFYSVYFMLQFFPILGFKTNDTFTYIFALFSINITASFEIIEWYKVLNHKKNKTIYRVMLNQSFPFILISLIFTCLVLLCIAFKLDFSCLNRKKISTDLITSISILLYFISYWIRITFFQTKQR